MTRTEKKELRNDIATKLADALGDILKHDDDHEEAVGLLEQALTSRSLLSKIEVLVFGEK
mgnify:FL=1